jgi:hypothetical protein
VYAIYGLTLLAARSVSRMVRAVARLGEGARIQSSHADGVLAPVVRSAAGTRGDVLMPTMRRPMSSEEFNVLRPACALTVATHRQVLISLRDMKGTVAATRGIIEQSRVLIAKSDAILVRQ